jgi:ElaB/YqjD/DUF883 family membrane-anchored ribosome-binding protein
VFPSPASALRCANAQSFPRHRRIVGRHPTGVANGKKAVAATDVYVHDNPWAALGVAGGIGFLLGLLLRRS